MQDDEKWTRSERWRKTLAHRRDRRRADARAEGRQGRQEEAKNLMRSCQCCRLRVSSSSSSDELMVWMIFWWSMVPVRSLAVVWVDVCAVMCEG